MTTKTVTYDDAKWLLVPKEITDEMERAIHRSLANGYQLDVLWDTVLAAAPIPPVTIAENASRDAEVEALKEQVRVTKEIDFPRKIEAVTKAIIDERDTLRAALAELEGVCREVYEVWAGSEGIPLPKTAAEAYLLQLVEQMRDAAKKGLK